MAYQSKLNQLRRANRLLCLALLTSLLLTGLVLTNNVKQLRVERANTERAVMTCKVMQRYIEQQDSVICNLMRWEIAKQEGVDSMSDEIKRQRYNRLND